MNKKFYPEYKMSLNIFWVNISLKIIFNRYFIVYNSEVGGETYFDRL